MLANKEDALKCTHAHNCICVLLLTYIRVYILHIRSINIGHKSAMFRLRIL